MQAFVLIYVVLFVVLLFFARVIQSTFTGVAQVCKYLTFEATTQLWTVHNLPTAVSLWNP